MFLFKLNPVGFSACSAGFLCLLPVPYSYNVSYVVAIVCDVTGTYPQCHFLYFTLLFLHKIHQYGKETHRSNPMIF